MYFIFPQSWITPAIAAAALSFGPIGNAGNIHVDYYSFSRPTVIAGTTPPDQIFIDKRSRGFWRKWRAQCVLVHQYGHLAGRGHSQNPRSIMYPAQRYRPCQRYRTRHHLR